MSAEAERVVAGDWYRLAVRDGAPIAWLDDRDGTHWAQLRLLASIDTLDGPDETLDVAGPRVEEVDGLTRLVWSLRSSRWNRKRLVIESGPDVVTVPVVNGSYLANIVRGLHDWAIIPGQRKLTVTAYDAAGRVLDPTTCKVDFRGRSYGPPPGKRCPKPVRWP